MRVVTWSVVMCLAVACGLDSHDKPDASAGTGGPSGSGGSSGTGGTGGTSGSGGVGGTSGSGGTGGTSGSGGVGGTGGTSGSGGSGGTSGTGGAGGGNEPECITADDCKLFNDCCNCESIPASADEPPVCERLCVIDACGSLGVSDVACVAGRCVLDANCNAADVVCGGLDPAPCEPGQTHVVNNGCFGGCVDSNECREVTSCDACGPDQVCVQYVTQLGPEVHCVDILPACNASPSCECMGNSTCTTPFDLCSDSNVGISCDCPVC